MQRGSEAKTKLPSFVPFITEIIALIARVMHLVASSYSQRNSDLTRSDLFSEPCGSLLVLILRQGLSDQASPGFLIPFSPFFLFSEKVLFSVGPINAPSPTCPWDLCTGSTYLKPKILPLSPLLPFVSLVPTHPYSYPQVR